MRTIFLNQEPVELPESVATIGVFDGVHLGHQRLIRRVLSRAQELGHPSMVITFDRQPRQVFDPAFQPQLLTTLEEKAAIFGQLGIDYLVILPFTREMASQTAEVFMRHVLRRQLNVGALVLGYDNRFGRNRAEGFEDYLRYGRQMGMEVLQGDAELMADGQRAVSSSVIRQMLSSEGLVDQMPRYLTRPYQLSGRVMPGEHIGHQLGFPTANLQPDSQDKLIPAVGVYAVWAILEDGQRYAAMMNIGMRPTFAGHRQTLEVNILDFDGDLYGQTVSVSFVRRLREERRFESPEALMAQLYEDRKEVEQIMRKEI